MSPDVVVNHQHCIVCGRAMAFDADERACSDACKAKLEAQNKKRRQMMWLLYGLVGLTLILLLLGRGTP
jgi:predicted nucleic acid-binding Zn ribbon protein